MNQNVNSIGNIRLYIITVLMVFGLMFIPTITQAQGFVPCTGGNECNACHLIQMANTIILWLVGFLSLLFAVVMMMAGFKLVTSGGNQQALDSAKTLFANAIIGFVIVLAAWLIVDTIMKAVVKPENLVKGYIWTGISCLEQVPSVMREGAGPDAFSVDGEVVAPGSVEGGTESHEAALALLADGIPVVSTGSCSDKTRSNCTSLDGIRPTTLQRVNELHAALGGHVVITGGTETGHADGEFSHGNGYKVDLRTTPQLNNYIMSNFESIGGNKWRDPHGNIYYRHGPVDHWDVTVTN